MSIFPTRFFWLPTAQRMPSLLPQLLWMWLTAPAPNCMLFT